MTVRIEQFDTTGGELLGRMLELRSRVYTGDDDYVPPFEGALEGELRRPAFAGRQCIFTARRPGEVVGYAVVRCPKELQLDGRKVATIGPFEALHDPEAVAELLEAAARWALEEGSAEVVGPLDGDTWHDHRLNLGPYDEPPFLMEPYNPSYYPEVWEQAGFEVLERYHSRRVDDLEGAARYHRPRWASARSLGYRVEPMTDGSIAATLDRVYDMVRVVFSDDTLFTPIRRAAFKKLYEGVESMLDGELSFFLVDRSGEDAGFAFVIPDYGRAVAAMDGRKNLWARAKFLANRRTDTANIRAFGVMPDHRGEGLASAMAHKFYAGMIDRGFEKANICLIPDDDMASVKIDGERGRILRRYALYRWDR